MAVPYKWAQVGYAGEFPLLFSLWGVGVGPIQIDFSAWDE